MYLEMKSQTSGEAVNFRALHDEDPGFGNNDVHNSYSISSESIEDSGADSNNQWNAVERFSNDAAMVADDWVDP